MLKPLPVTFLAGILGLLLAGCTTKPESPAPAPAPAGPAAPPKARRAPLHGEGMTKLRGIT